MQILHMQILHLRPLLAIASSREQPTNVQTVQANMQILRAHMQTTA